jgi:hypothetical protein
VLGPFSRPRAQFFSSGPRSRLITYLLYGFSKFSILIGWQAVQKTHIRTVVRIFRIWTGVPDVVYLAGNFCFANRKKFCFLNFKLCFTDKNLKQRNCFWLSMHATVYCYPVKLTIADLIRKKSICSQTQFSHIINRLLTSLVLSVLWNIGPLFFAWTSLLRRSVLTTRSDISQYRPHARSISR